MGFLEIGVKTQLGEFSSDFLQITFVGKVDSTRIFLLINPYRPSYARSPGKRIFSFSKVEQQSQLPSRPHCATTTGALDKNNGFTAPLDADESIKVSATIIGLAVVEKNALPLLEVRRERGNDAKENVRGFSISVF